MRIISIVEGTSAAAFPHWLFRFASEPKPRLLRAAQPFCQQPAASCQLPLAAQPLLANGAFYALPFCLCVCRDKRLDMFVFAYHSLLLGCLPCYNKYPISVDHLFNGLADCVGFFGSNNILLPTNQLHICSSLN